MDRNVVEQQIREAFKDVTLGGGVSLCQAQVDDRYGEGFTEAELSVLVHPEIIDDWARVPFRDLDDIKRRGAANFAIAIRRDLE